MRPYLRCVGSLCENNDKFAIDRKLPKIDIGDLLVIHDTGAHGFAMGYNYNGKLKSAEILLQEDGSTRMIAVRRRRKITLRLSKDLISKINFKIVLEAGQIKYRAVKYRAIKQNSQSFMEDGEKSVV